MKVMPGRRLPDGRGDFKAVAPRYSNSGIAVSECSEDCRACVQSISPNNLTVIAGRDRDFAAARFAAASRAVADSVPVFVH